MSGARYGARPGDTGPRDTRFRDSATASWLLGVILLLLVVWVASLLIVPDDDGHAGPRPPARTIASSHAFLAWVSDSLPADSAGMDDRMVLDALRRLNIAQGSVAAAIAPDLAPRLATVDSLLLSLDARVATASSDDSPSLVAAAVRESADILAELRQRLPPGASTPGDAEAPGDPERAAAAATAAAAALDALDARAGPGPFSHQLRQALHALAAGLAAVAGAAGVP